MNRKFDYEKIVELYQKYQNSTLVAKELKCSVTTVCKVLKRHNIPICRRLKHYFDLNFFEKIDTEEKAYWLGFLYADGGVTTKNNNYTLSLSLSTKDIEHLEKFKKVLNATNPIRTKPGSGYLPNNYYVAFDVYSKKLVTDLINVGCYPNKSLTLKFPNTNYFNDSSLIRHFIRGYFDGDGSVFISNEKHWRHKRIFPVIHFRFCGTYEMLSEIQKILNIGGTLKHSKSAHNNYELAYKRRKRAKIFMEYLYKDATIYLDRKYQIFKNNL